MIFARFFVVFVPDSMTFATDPRVDYRVGSSGTTTLAKLCIFEKHVIVNNLDLEDTQLKHSSY